MCGPAAAAPVAVAGPGAFFGTVAPAVAASTAAASGGFATLALSGAGASLFSTASQALQFVSPLGDALGAMSGLGGTDDMRALGQMNAQISMINMNQQLIEAQRDEIDRREQAQKELAAVLTGGTQGQSMSALANKIQRDIELDKSFFDTRIGQISVAGKADTATIQYKTLEEIQNSRNKAFGSLGKAAGKVATAIA